MPQVPIYQQQVGGTNAGFQQDLNSDPYGMRVPMNHDIGNGLTQAAKLAKQYQNDLDESFVYQKLNDLKRYAQDQRTGENGYLKLKGYDAIARDDEGYGLAERTDKALKSYGDSLQESLTPRQKKLFAKSAMGIYDQQYGFASQHVMVQSDAFSNGQDDGTIDTANRVAAQNVGNPDVFNDQINDTIRATMRKARRNGWSEEQTQAEIEKNVSNLVYEAGMSAIQSAQTPEEQIEKVSWIKDSYGKYLRGTQLAWLTASLNKAGDSIAVRSGAESAAKLLIKDPRKIDVLFNAMGFRTKVGPGSMGDAASAIFHFGIVPQESGGMQLLRDEKGNVGYLIGVGADGKRPKNQAEWAYGASQMQLKIGEAAAKLDNTPWNEEKFKTDLAYNTKLGAVWADHLLKQYDGDIPKMLAAYHNGETQVNNAIKKAEKAGTPDKWLDYLGPQGQKYVSDVMARMKKYEAQKLTNPDGTSATFFSAKAALSEFRETTEKEARAYLSQFYPGRPDLLDKAVDSFMEKQASAKKDYYTEQLNVRNDIIENYLMKGAKFSDIPENVISQLNWKAQQEVAEVFAKKAKGDRSGNKELAFKYLNNLKLWTSYSKEEMRAELQNLPQDDADKLEALWHQANDGGQATAEELKQLQFVAQKNPDVFIPMFSTSSEVVQKALKLTIPQDWGKWKTPERDALVSAVTSAIYRVGVQRGSAFKTAEELQKDSTFMQAAGDIYKTAKWWNPFGSDKSVFTMKKGDIPNNNRSDAWPVLKALATNQRNGRGLSGEASDGETMNYFIDFVLSPTPDYDLKGVYLDKTRWDFYEREYPNEPEPERLKRYIRDRVRGVELPRDPDILDTATATYDKQLGTQRPGAATSVEGF